MLGNVANHFENLAEVKVMLKPSKQCGKV